MNHESQEAALEEALKAVETVEAAMNAIMEKKDISMLQKSCKRAANQKEKGKLQ